MKDLPLSHSMIKRLGWEEQFQLTLLKMFLHFLTTYIGYKCCLRSSPLLSIWVV